VRSTQKTTKASVRGKRDVGMSCSWHSRHHAKLRDRIVIAKSAFDSDCIAGSGIWVCRDGPCKLALVASYSRAALPTPLHTERTQSDKAGRNSMCW
jgi:hypothetical protein